MIEIHKILVPVDFSEPSMRAVNCGISLALQFDATLFFAHVVPSSMPVSYTFPYDIFTVQKHQFEQAKKLMNTLMPEEFKDRVRHHLILKGGSIEEELLGMVHEEHIDLVAMGTHGRRAPGRWFLGSVTEHMLRKVPVPVLTVSRLDPKRKITVPGPVCLKRLLYAADFSEGSEASLHLAVDLAREFGAELLVVHVVDLRWVWSGEAVMPELEFQHQQHLKSAKKELESSVTKARQDCKISTLVLEGVPSETILGFAGQNDVDLIVLNIYGKSRLERVMLGSTAERLVRGAHIPVLSVPAVSGVRADWVTEEKKDVA